MTTKTTPAAIRLSITKDVALALRIAKQRYPALSEPEILKLGLSRIVTDNLAKNEDYEKVEITQDSASSVGKDYLSDPTEDIYNERSGKKVSF